MTTEDKEKQYKEEWWKDSWYGLLYRLRKEFDPLYVANDDKQKIRDRLLFGTAGFILLAVLTTAVGIVVKVIFHSTP